MTDEDKKRIEQLMVDNKATIDHIKELRDQLFAHDKLERKQEEFRIPSTNNLDKLFDAVKEIYNLISKGATGDFYVWPDDTGDEMKWIFGELLINLEKGKTQRFKEQDENGKKSIR